MYVLYLTIWSHSCTDVTKQRHALCLNCNAPIHYKEYIDKNNLMPVSENFSNAIHTMYSNIFFLLLCSLKGNLK